MKTISRLLIILVISSQNIFANVEEIKSQMTSQKKNEKDCLFYPTLYEQNVAATIDYLNKNNIQYFTQGQNLLISLSKEKNVEIRKLQENQDKIMRYITQNPKLTNHPTYLTNQMDLLKRLTKQCELKQ